MASGYKELVEELNKHKLEVSRLKNSLNGLDAEKESWFRKKEELSGRIRNFIQKIKDSKAKRDALTLEVRGLKPKRDDINKELPLKSAELDKLKKERLELSKSIDMSKIARDLGIKTIFDEPRVFDIKGSPSRIKQQMEKLEFKIETDTVSFEKEKELMKKIKELKKDYDKVSILEESNKKIRGILDSARGMKKEANETHKLMQEKAKQSQVLHEDILKISAEIDKMKADENDAFKKFLDFKKKFNEVNAQLKEKLKSINEIKWQLDKMDLDRKEKKMLERESFLKSKEDAVNEKLRKGQKLTTEDLLVFQKSEK